jgi:hypothetical protein
MYRHRHCTVTGAALSRHPLTCPLWRCVCVCCGVLWCVQIVIELNDTAIGLAHRYEEEDYAHMRALVLLRMSEHYPIPHPNANPPGGGDLKANAPAPAAVTATATPADATGDAKSPPAVQLSAVTMAVASAAPSPPPSDSTASPAAGAGAGAGAVDTASEVGALRFRLPTETDALTRLKATTAALEAENKKLKEQSACCTVS